MNNGLDAIDNAEIADVIWDLPLSITEIQLSLDGIARSLRIKYATYESLMDWMNQVGSYDRQRTNAGPWPSFREWHACATEHFGPEHHLCHLMNLALAINCLQHQHWKGSNGNPQDELSVLKWSAISAAFRDPHLVASDLGVASSSQNCYTLPICDIPKREAAIREQVVIQIYLPAEGSSRDHCSMAWQSSGSQHWVLAGEATATVRPLRTDLACEASPDTHISLPDSGQKNEADTFLPANCSIVASQANRTVLSTKSRSYFETPSGSDVAVSPLSGMLFAQLVRKVTMVKEACPLPSNIPSSDTGPSPQTLQNLLNAVDAIRSWEESMRERRHYALRAEWELAILSCCAAIKICNTTSGFPNPCFYIAIASGEYGSANRQLGRFQKAHDLLLVANSGLTTSIKRIKYLGELGVVYRHLGRLDDAKDAFGEQYDLARAADVEKQACRAVGNLGMINYVISTMTGDTYLLEKAVKQLQERIERSRRLGTRHGECVGLARLSLCQTALGNTDLAAGLARSSLELALALPNTGLSGFSRMVHGRALLREGRRAEALEQFNPQETCTAAIAMCREPCEERRQFLQELVDVGADFDIVDEQGYKALDYAVFNNDSHSEALVLEGLRRQLGLSSVDDIQLHRRRREARLRKCYREVLQERLRPILYDRSPSKVQRLRLAYAQTLAEDEEAAALFDSLRFVRYTDFKRFGNPPSSAESLTQKCSPLPLDSEQAPIVDFIIFISYRWLNTLDSDRASPDDSNHTQYRRMLQAVGEFLKLHQEVRPDRLGIWLDYACVNQETPAAGVAALPMLLAQCNALICLTDDAFYDRAWCSIEMLMMQTLQRSYGLHLWYEHVLPGQHPQNDDCQPVASLRKGPMDLQINVAEKKLSFESDRANILFLARQSRLLG